GLTCQRSLVRVQYRPPTTYLSTSGIRADRPSHAVGGSTTRDGRGSGSLRARLATTPTKAYTSTGISRWYCKPALRALARCSGPTSPVRATAGVTPPCSED